VPFKEKTGNVMFIAANCDSYNDRESYVKALMNYTKVESYGKCLHNMNGTTIEGNREELWSFIAKHKFILAFENSNCEDYISEKVLNAFRAGVIPVVSGPIDYSTYAPSGQSVINVRDFESPKALAAYLEKVGNNQTLYEQYLSYKNPPSGEGLTDKFKAIWGDRGPWSVFCEIGEQMIDSGPPSKLQAGTALNPIDMNQCEEAGFMRKMYVEGTYGTS